MTRGDRGLQKVTGGFKGFQGVPRGLSNGDRGLQGMTGDYKGLQ